MNIMTADGPRDLQTFPAPRHHKEHVARVQAFVKQMNSPTIGGWQRKHTIELDVARELDKQVCNFTQALATPWPVGSQG